MRKSLSKKEIIKKQPEINRAFKTGQKFSCHGLKLIVASNDLPFSRLIVIPVKHYGNAVQRNRIRRQLKEIWRCDKENFKSGYDFVFLVYPGKVVEYSQQKKKLIDLCVEAGVYIK
ncbi:MAG: ribonuclease P protein component [Spirochaetaceae bacterium]|nr:ribonuclease P protein component [Spirochaetaceae bacterium]